MDRSIMSTPGGVPGGLWAECSGYRTLTEEEQEVLSWVCLAFNWIKTHPEMLFPWGKCALSSCLVSKPSSTFCTCGPKLRFQSAKAMPHIKKKKKMMTLIETMFVSNVFCTETKKSWRVQIIFALLQRVDSGKPRRRQRQEKKRGDSLTHVVRQEVRQQTYPPRSALVSVAVVPADGGSAGDVFLTHCDTSTQRPTHT